MKHAACYFRSGALLVIFWLLGCNTLPTKPDPVRIMNWEPSWIRQGQPIIFEGEKWFPQDDVENLLDSELYFLGEYQGVEFFAEKTDVRPYGRLYTKFAKNKYRLFEKKFIDD